MKDYYRINRTKLSYGEVWRFGNPVGFLTFAVLKILGREWIGSQLIPAQPGIVVLRPEEVREDYRSQMQETINAVLACGFEEAFYYQVNTQGPARGVALVTFEPAGLAMCIIAFATAGLRREINTSVVSKSKAGKYIGTNNGRNLLNPPPEIEILNLRGHSPSEVISTHFKRIEGIPVVKLQKADLEPMILDSQKFVIDYNLHRGVYVPVS